MNESLLKISSADLCYGKKLFLKALLNIFLGFITLKHWRIAFCNTCTFLCMLPLKTVRFYKSEIAFIFIFAEEIFAEVYLKKNFQHGWRIFILQKTLWFTRKNNKWWYKLNKFLPQNKISGVLNHRNIEKFLLSIIYLLWEISFITFFLWCYWHCSHSTTKIWQSSKYEIRKFK